MHRLRRLLEGLNSEGNIHQFSPTCQVVPNQLVCSPKSVSKFGKTHTHTNLWVLQDLSPLRFSQMSREDLKPCEYFVLSENILRHLAVMLPGTCLHQTHAELPFHKCQGGVSHVKAQILPVLCWISLQCITEKKLACNSEH